MNFVGNIVGIIVGNIEGYSGAALVGNYPAGNLVATLRHLKTVCQRWHASGASRYKMLAVLTPCQHPASGLPSVSTPKLKGVDSDMESIVQSCWHFAGSTGQLAAASKVLAVLAKCWQAASGRLVFIFPEGKEGVNIVNNPVLAIGVGIKDLGVAIDPNHSGATV